MSHGCAATALIAVVLLAGSARAHFYEFPQILEVGGSMQTPEGMIDLPFSKSHNQGEIFIGPDDPDAVSYFYNWHHDLSLAFESERGGMLLMLTGGAGQTIFNEEENRHRFEVAFTPTATLGSNIFAPATDEAMLFSADVFQAQPLELPGHGGSDDGHGVRDHVTLVLNSDFTLYLGGSLDAQERVTIAAGARLTILNAVPAPGALGLGALAGFFCTLRRRG